MRNKIYFILGHRSVVAHSYDYNSINSFYENLIKIGFKDIKIMKKKLSNLSDKDKELIERSSTELIRVSDKYDIYLPYIVEERFHMEFSEYLYDLELLLDQGVNSICEYIRFDNYDAYIIEKFYELLSIHIEKVYESNYVDDNIDEYKFYLSFIKDYYKNKKYI